jgi:hypothetical protein
MNKKKAILHDHRQKKLDLFIAGANKKTAQQQQQQDKQAEIDYPITACSCSWVEQTYDDPDVVPQIDYKNAHPWYPLWCLRNEAVSKWRGKTIVSANPKNVKLEVVWAALPLSGSDIHYLGGIPYAICSDNIFVCIPEGTDKNKIVNPDEGCIFEDWRFYFLLSSGEFEVIPNDMLQKYVPRYYKRIDTIDHRNIVTIKYENTTIVLPALPPALFKERMRKASSIESNPINPTVCITTPSSGLFASGSSEPVPPIKNSNQQQTPTASIGSTNGNTETHSSDFQQRQTTKTKTTATTMSTAKTQQPTTKSSKAPAKQAPPPPKTKTPVVEVDDDDEEEEVSNEMISEDTNGAIFNEEDVEEEEEGSAATESATVDEQDVEEEEEATVVSQEPPPTQVPVSSKKQQQQQQPIPQPTSKTPKATAPPSTSSKPKKDVAPPPVQTTKKSKPSKPQTPAPSKKAVVQEVSDDLEDEEDEPYVEDEADEDEEVEDKEAGTEDEETDDKKDKWTLVETEEHTIAKSQPKTPAKKAAAATKTEETNGATVSRINLKSLKRPIGEKEVAAPAREPKKSKAAAATETEEGDSATATTESTKKTSSKKSDPNAPKPADKKTKIDIVRDNVNELCKEKANAIRSGKKQVFDWMEGKSIAQKKERFDAAWPWLFTYGVPETIKRDPLKSATLKDLEEGKVFDNAGFKTYVQLLYDYFHGVLPIDHHSKQPSTTSKPKLTDMDDL